MSRLNDDDRGLPASARLVELMAELAEPTDFWDRPDGDFGPLTARYRLDREGWELANSLYLLGSKALGRNELAVAADWLGQAAEAGHPGAMFRLAAVSLRAGEDWAHEARFLVAEAARHGHGDADRLLADMAHRRRSDEPDSCEDTEFFDEVRIGLGIPPVLCPEPAATSPSRHAEDITTMDGEKPAGAQAGPKQEGPGRPGRPQLFFVPAPRVPTAYAASPHSSGERHLHLASPLGETLQLPLPELRPDVAAVVQLVRQDAEPATGEGRDAVEPWWSASALRPAILNDMARHRHVPARVPQRWQTTRRARDLMHLIASAGGISTRTLADRAKISMNATVLLLDWLRDLRLVETVAGVHFPGTVMDLVTRPDPGKRMLNVALGELRDELGAAVYISTYAHGEIEIKGSAHSPSAPPVTEWAPFTDTGHASAVGKSLLAQLDFDSRMDHLHRYPSIPLTDRTITSRRALIEALDEPGPHAAQFDLLEYSPTEVCVAFSLGLPGRASSVALSLPAREHTRLIAAARGLSQKATGLLLAHLLAEDQPATGVSKIEDEPRRALP